MGFKNSSAWRRTVGQEPQEEINWGVERTWLGDRRYSGDGSWPTVRCRADGPHRRTRRGPNGNRSAARGWIFAKRLRAAMNDEETVALIAGATIRKSTAPPIRVIRRARTRSARRSKSKAWVGKMPSAAGEAAQPSRVGLESAWTSNRPRWTNGFFDNLFKYEWN